METIRSGLRGTFGPRWPIEPDAGRIQGYSRRHLRQHGLDPEEAHQWLRVYAGLCPVVGGCAPHERKRMR